MFKKLKLLVIICLSLLMVLGGLSYKGHAYQTYVKKNLEAWFYDIKVLVNGEEKNVNPKPFIVNGSTYVPLRSIGDIFNKNIEWDGSNYKILISDKSSSESSNIEFILASKEYKISMLQGQVKRLESEKELLERQLEEYKTSKADLDDLEDELNDDYDEYRDIEFDISLSGDEDDITVKIEFDLDDYEEEWRDISKGRKEEYLQDICDDILDEYDDADINGYIKDEDSGDKLLSFSLDSDEEVKLEEEKDFDDLEDDIDDEYYRYFRDINTPVSLEKDGDEITFEITIDFDRYEDEWKDLTDEEIQDFMGDIYYEIEDYYDDDDYEIIGQVIKEEDDDEDIIAEAIMQGNIVRLYRY